MESILEQITGEKAWEKFLASRLVRRRFNWRSFEEADTYVAERRYLTCAKKIFEGESLGIPYRKVINKMGTGKKRIVYSFTTEKMRILKLIAYLLYRYDGVFAPNCYAFRQGIHAGDAIRKLKKALRGRKMWAYKVDIQNYFNSISVPILLPILSGILKDDPLLYDFFVRLLSDDRAMVDDTIIHEQRGVMAGLPTASFLADVYLSEVDWYFFNADVIYARYSDDIIFFAPDRGSLEQYKKALLGFLEKYNLKVNYSKEQYYAPDEPFEFLGFRCLGREIGISSVTLDKLKGKIRRKARAIRRWCSQKGKSPEQGIRRLICCFNHKLLDMDDDSLCWASWFFPVINRTEGLREIDNYLQENCRFVATGHHNKANYRIRYTLLKQMGYRSLLHEYYANKYDNNKRVTSLRYI